jgi:hypothetical protein
MIDTKNKEELLAESKKFSSLPDKGDKNLSSNPLRPRAFGGKGAEGMKTGFQLLHALCIARSRAVPLVGQRLGGIN